MRAWRHTTKSAGAAARSGGRVAAALAASSSTSQRPPGAAPRAARPPARRSPPGNPSGSEAASGAAAGDRTSAAPAAEVSVAPAARESGTPAAVQVVSAGGLAGEAKSDTPRCCTCRASSGSYLHAATCEHIRSHTRGQDQTQKAVQYNLTPLRVTGFCVHVDRSHVVHPSGAYVDRSEQAVSSSP